MTNPHPNRQTYQRQQAVVVWGCKEHQTPAGQECQGCADQGELFSRADAARSARKKFPMTITIKPRKTVASDQEGCQGCGESGGLRWVGSTAGADSWTCNECGHQRRIAVHEPGSHGTNAQRRGTRASSYPPMGI
jgi:RNase P subunit RPR2